jgi:hypothetical protein
MNSVLIISGKQERSRHRCQQPNKTGCDAKERRRKFVEFESANFEFVALDFSAVINFC